MGESIIDQDENGEFHQICLGCSTKSECSICVNNGVCQFDNMNIHPEIQPYVMKVEHQGPMTISRQAPNEKRIEAVCKNCLCYNPEDKDKYCYKQIGKCKNYKVNWRN